MLQTNSLGEIDLTIGNEVTKYLADIRAILTILSPTNFSMPLPWSTETTQIMGVSNQPMTVSNSLPICFQLGPIKGTHQFLLVCSATIHLLGQNFLEVHKAHIFSSQKGEIFLHFELLTNDIQKDSSMDSSIAIPVFSVTLTEPNTLLDSITN